MSENMTGPATGTRRCLVTGASGYVGGRVKRHLLANGWAVTELRRRPDPAVEYIPFELGGPVDPQALKGYDGLVHCAYDFRQVEWQGIHARNVDGSRRLIEAAREAGIGRIVYISSISAFEGCRSMYGKAKLEVERSARDLGAWSIRPGLVFGETPGAMFGQLVANIGKSSVLPMPGPGDYPMYLVHETDLCEAIRRCLEPERPVHPGPVTVAHERMWLFRDMLHEIARLMGRKVTLVPVPGTLMWAGLRGAEMLRLPIGMRSDSLVSLMHQNSSPDLNAKPVLDLECRPFGEGLRLTAPAA